MFNWFAINQSDSEVSDNYAAQQRKYVLQLNRRLERGEISREYYDQEIRLTKDSLDYAQWEGMKTLVVEVAKNATVNLDETGKRAAGYVAAGAGAVAGYAGEILGKAANNAGKGLFSNIGFSGAALAVLAIAIWAFTVGPLSQKKFK